MREKYQAYKLQLNFHKERTLFLYPVVLKKLHGDVTDFINDSIRVMTWESCERGFNYAIDSYTQDIVLLLGQSCLEKKSAPLSSWSLYTSW